MPRSNQTGEFNTFVGGLVTEASPLTFPENASIDEANFILNKDGSRRRRLGMDYETGLTPYPISYTISPVGDIAVSTFEWTDVAGITNKSFVVCQVHDKAYIVSRAETALKSSSYVKSTVTLCTTCATPAKASFASIDGRLVIAYGEATVKVVSYIESTDTFSTESVSIKTRDLFGVADPFTISGTEVDLLSPEYINYRPVSTADEDLHMYNLRNQGWAIPRLQWGPEVKTDPVNEFEDQSGDNRGLPSNADSPVGSIYANSADSEDKNSERFNSDASARQEPAKARAATGHYVIDLLDRGQSREASVSRTTNTTTGLHTNANPAESTKYVSFRTPTVTLPEDKTEGGIGVVAEFAGRVWYGGFSSKVTGGDSQSPKLASYLFYSQQVQHESQISNCYQEGDPTDIVAPELIDTDGGFVRLSGAYNIQALVNIGTGLLAFAENGVWLVGGSDNGLFSANNQSVSKITEHGTLSPQSLVLVDSTVMYWSDDAIYHLAPTQFGDLQAKELSVNIRTYYQAIGDAAKVECQGIFDTYEKKVRWLFDNVAGNGSATELVFDLVLAAFTPITIGLLTGSSQPLPASPIQVSPFNISSVDLSIVVDEDLVLADADLVVAGTDLPSGGFRSTAYLTLINADNPSNTSLTFSTYNNLSFKDWESVDSVGVDAAAFMLTGYLGTGDYQRFKQVPYIYFHFLRTEDGFTDDGDDFLVLNESSCLVRSQWDWSNSASYGKWGKEFQAYRYRRQYIPSDVTDTYDYGTTTIVSKSKLRGRGRVVSLLISSEEAKDMQLLGWGMNIGSNNNV